MAHEVAPAQGLMTETTDDAFLGGALSVLQPRRGYRAGLDAVVLAASAPVGASAEGGRLRVIDVGAGAGVIGLCLARRLPHVHVLLVERDPFLAGLARENAARNGLSDRVEVLEADITAPLSTHAGLAGRAGTFDLALANPPYYAEEAGTLAPDALKARSHAMPEGAFDGWLRFMAAMLRAGGQIGLVHRADALDLIIEACRRRFGALRIRPVHSYASEAANRILVMGTKGSRAPLQVLPALLVHQDDGRFTVSLDDALRRGAALPLPVAD